MRTQEIARHVQSVQERRLAADAISVVLEVKGQADDKVASHKRDKRMDASRLGNPGAPMHSVVWLLILTDKDLRRIRMEPIRCRGLEGEPG